MAKKKKRERERERKSVQICTRDTCVRAMYTYALLSAHASYACACVFYAQWDVCARAHGPGGE